MIEDPFAPGRGRCGRHHGDSHAALRATTSTGNLRLGVCQITVLVDPSPAGVARLRLAAHLAKAFDADVLGIGVLPVAGDEGNIAAARAVAAAELVWLPPPSPAGTTDVGTGVRGVDMGAPGDQAELEQLFRHEMESASVFRTEWRVIGYGGVDEMIAYAQQTDLCILGQAQPESWSDPGFQPEDVALASSSMTLLVPTAGAVQPIGHCVLVAWDGSREVMRVLRDGLPLMRDAHRILLVEVDRPETAGPERLTLEAAVEFLGRHGVQAFVEQVQSLESKISDVLLQKLSDLDADLLLAGFYHHSHMREALFGGVSRELLARVTVPMLLAH